MKRIWISILFLFMIRTAYAAEPGKLDAQLVGNFFSFSNPSAGGGTQMWTVDIDETGSYMAFCTNADFDAVRGQLEVAGDKWTLKDGDKTIDQGNFQVHGPQVTFNGGKGSMLLSKANPQSRQSILKEFDINPKDASLESFLQRGLKMAREWKKDAILVDVRCNPDVDGAIDITTQGGNLMMMYYSPSRDAGAMAMVSAWGEITLMPEKTPVSPWKLPIPTNVIDLKTALATAKEGGVARVKDAELYGIGNDPDLRTYCWVMRTEDGVACVNAVIPQTVNYREFVGGMPRAGSQIPFDVNTSTVWRITVYGSEGLSMYWCRRHAVFLDGIDEAITVKIPWRWIDESEWRPFTHTEKDGTLVLGDMTDKLKAGKFTPLNKQQQERYRMQSDVVELACPPGLVELENCPKELIPRVKAQLESYWKSTQTKAESPRRTRK